MPISILKLPLKELTRQLTVKARLSYCPSTTVVAIHYLPKLSIFKVYTVIDSGTFPGSKLDLSDFTVHGTSNITFHVVVVVIIIIITIIITQI
jgi:hypothetical protein